LREMKKTAIATIPPIIIGSNFRAFSILEFLLKRF